VDHQFQVRQVDAARGDVGGDAHAGAAVAHGLQRVGAFCLAEFARQRHDLRSPVLQAGVRWFTAARVLQKTMAFCAS
jgi:hypothetical protein